MTPPLAIVVMSSGACGPPARCPRGDGKRLAETSSAGCVLTIVKCPSIRRPARPAPEVRPGRSPAVRRPFMRHRPRRHPRSAPPAPSDTTSAARARTPGTRLPDSPRSSAPGRTATNGRSRAEGTLGPRASVPASVLSMHPESRRQPAILEPPRSEPSPAPATRVVADPPPTALSHAACRTPGNRQPQRREHRPHSRPPADPGPPPDRVPLARQMPQDTSGAATRRRRRRDRPDRRAVPGTPRT